MIFAGDVSCAHTRAKLRRHNRHPARTIALDELADGIRIFKRRRIFVRGFYQEPWAGCQPNSGRRAAQKATASQSETI
jgi:hypothetical protein